MLWCHKAWMYSLCWSAMMIIDQHNEYNCVCRTALSGIFLQTNKHQISRDLGTPCWSGSSGQCLPSQEADSSESCMYGVQVNCNIDKAVICIADGAQSPPGPPDAGKCRQPSREWFTERSGGRRGHLGLHGPLPSPLSLYMGRPASLHGLYGFYSLGVTRCNCRVNSSLFKLPFQNPAHTETMQKQSVLCIM